MYLVFIAMLALNVPAEVLDGFDLVEEGLKQTIETTESQNNIIVRNLTEINEDNPEKAGQTYVNADNFNKQSDQLYNYIQDLKIRIAKEADGKNANVDNIQRRDGLGPASEIMLGPGEKEGEKLRNSINSYRDLAINLVQNNTKKENIRKRLTTEVPSKSRLDNKNWEETYFEQMPTSAAITLLTKIQSDVRAAQGEVLADLYGNIDAGDYRVNLLEAQVIPESEFVMSGGTYKGQVVLSAVDTTKRPRFSLPGIGSDGRFTIPAGGVGINKTFSGNLLVDIDGEPFSIPFESKYHVVPRTSTIQLADANILYAGEENKLVISAPGFSNDQLSPRPTNGVIRKGDDGRWIAIPEKAGTDMKISVYSGTTLVDEQIFRTRLLPAPTPYIAFRDAEGNPQRYRTGRIAKANLLAASGVKASIDDGFLDREFTVIRFNTVFFDAMGNAVREPSDGPNFSERQKSQMRQLTRGKSFFISDVKATRGGVERDLSALEVKIN